MAEKQEPLYKVRHVVKFQHEDKKKLQMVILFQIALIVSLCIMTYTDWSKQPEPVYFILNKNEQIIQPEPLNKTHLNNAAIINWYANAIMRSFAFNYKNKETRLQEIKSFYTPNGFKKYLNTLVNNEAFSSIDIEKLIISLRILEAPEILQDGVVNGIYTWDIKIPVLIFAQNQLTNRAYQFEVETIITRVPETVSPIGLQIDDFIVLSSQQTVFGG